MRSVVRAVIAAACVSALVPLSGCGGGAPEDARLQIDDFVEKGPNDFRVFPSERVSPVPVRQRFPCIAKHPEWSAYNSPEMMALGGSIFNGVSSMQINWWLADWSPPAQVARALSGATESGPVPNMRMAPYPDYGIDPFKPEGPGWTFRLGLDLETSGITELPTAVRRQGYTMERLRLYRPGSPPFADNLSFAGASIDDILYGTPKDYRARLDLVRRIDTIKPDRSDFWADGPQPRSYASILEHARWVHLMGDATKTAAALPTLFFALNSAFVLDPTHDECLENMTALDQVLLRQPKRLLVGVGSNSGLFTFMGSGQPVDQFCGSTSISFGKEIREWKRYVPITRTSDEEFLDRMKILLDRLDRQGAGIEHIYVMGQLRPRVVANLVPTSRQGAVGIDSEYPPGQLLAGPKEYHPEYTLSFAPGGSRRIPGDDVKAADELNARVNDRLEAMVKSYNRGSEKRFVFVDLTPIEDHDVKHRARNGKPGEAYEVTKDQLPGLNRKIVLDNMPLEFSLDKVTASGKVIGQRVVRGGMFSIDNLHPTVVGYAALAGELLKAMRDTEPKLNIDDKVIASVSPAAAYIRFAGRTDGVDGNILHSGDEGLVARRLRFQAAIDAFASLRNGKLDCWERSPGPQRVIKQ